MKDSVTRLLLIQKYVALAITFGLFFAIGNTYNFMLAAIVLGQSHFVLAYSYKLAARKIRLKNFAIFIAFAVALFAFFYRIDFPDYRIESLLFITTVYAIYHTITDDQFTLNFFKPVYSRYQKLQMLTLTFILVGLHTSWQFAPSYGLIFILIGLYFMLYFFFLSYEEKRKLNGADYFFLGQAVFALVLFTLDIRVYFGRMLMISFIGIYHYLIYYLHYWAKISSLPPQTRALNTKPGYLSMVIASNIIMFGLFAIMLVTQNKILGYFFGYNLFLVLTLLHFISSTRINEFFTLLDLRKG